MEDWASETYANAEKDIEKQKQEWEDAQQRHLQELEMAEQENDEDDSEEEEEDMVTYLSIDAKNKVEKKKTIPRQSLAKSKPPVKRVVPISKMNGEATVITVSTPKRRGRPPKNRSLISNSNSVSDNNSNGPVSTRLPSPVPVISISSSSSVRVATPEVGRKQRFIPSPNKVVTRRSGKLAPPVVVVPDSRCRAVAKLAIKKSCVALQKRDTKTAAATNNSRPGPKPRQVKST